VTLGILTLLCLLFTVYDLYATQTFGYRTELNPLVAKLVSRLGTYWGSAIGISVPSLCWILGCLAFNAPVVLAFYVGSRFTLALWQHRILSLMRASNG
jgi:hypothetical protein